jgi:ABC-2 type transport system permease protein
MNGVNRITQIVRKELLELWRNAGVVALVLAIPVIEVIILGYATAGGINDLPAAVYDADRSLTSRRLISAIDQSRSFEVTWLETDLSQAEKMLDKNEVNALFIIPTGFERALTELEGEATVAAMIDGSNIAVARYAASYAEQITGRFTSQVLNEHSQVGSGQELLIAVEPRIWYNQDLRRENFYMPALLGTMLALVVLALTAVSIVRERERGTLEQILVSPTRPLELIIGKLIPIIIISYIELALMLLIAVQIFNVPIRGSLALYAGLMFIYLLAEMGVGIFISTISRNQAQALPTIFLLVTMDSILAGFITPVEVMPQIVQRISVVVPLRHFVAITRELFAKGAGFEELAPYTLPLIVMSLVLFAASTSLLRRRLV